MQLKSLIPFISMGTVVGVIAATVCRTKETVRVRHNTSAFVSGYNIGRTQGKHNAEKCFEEMKKNENIFSAFYNRYINGGAREISNGFELGYKRSFLEHFDKLVSEAVPDDFYNDNSYDELDKEE